MKLHQIGNLKSPNQVSDEERVIGRRRSRSFHTSENIFDMKKRLQMDPTCFLYLFITQI